MHPWHRRRLTRHYNTQTRSDFFTFAVIMCSIMIILAEQMSFGDTH